MSTPQPRWCAVKRRRVAIHERLSLSEDRDGRAAARRSGRLQALKRTTIFVMVSRPLQLRSAGTVVSLRGALQQSPALTTTGSSAAIGSLSSLVRAAHSPSKYVLCSAHEHASRRRQRLSAKGAARRISCRQEMMSIIDAVMTESPHKVASLQKATGKREAGLLEGDFDADVVAHRRRSRFDVDEIVTTPCAHVFSSTELPVLEPCVPRTWSQLTRVRNVAKSALKTPRSALSSSVSSTYSRASRRYGVLFDCLAFRPLELDLIKMHDLCSN
ncbi:hypothetical protein PYCC9005_004391 [Savitreella phatthalungensis]